MRISDWSSDVCSSDLQRELYRALRTAAPEDGGRTVRARSAASLVEQQSHRVESHPLPPSAALRSPCSSDAQLSVAARLQGPAGTAHGISGHVLHGDDPADIPVSNRSEEHTSELQSLMRISYAV